MPASTRLRFRSVCAKRPAAKATATRNSPGRPATGSTIGFQLCFDLTADLLLCSMPMAKLLRVICHAGNRPKPTRAPSSSVEPSKVAAVPIWGSMGMICPRPDAQCKRSELAARPVANASTPPIAASTTASIATWRRTLGAAGPQRNARGDLHLPFHQPGQLQVSQVQASHQKND